MPRSFGKAQVIKAPVVDLLKSFRTLFWVISNKRRRKPFPKGGEIVEGLVHYGPPRFVRIFLTPFGRNGCSKSKILSRMTNVLQTHLVPVQSAVLQDRFEQWRLESILDTHSIRNSVAAI